MNRELMNLVDNYRQDIINSTVEVVKIKSVEASGEVGKPFGRGLFDALEYMLDLGRRLGFITKNLDGYCGYCEYGEGEETIGILVHLDVVPEGKGWSHDPYGGEIVGEMIYGRGTIDDKGPAVASMYALKAIKDLGIEMNRRVRIIFGTNEETNWKGIEYYFKHEKRPDLGFTPDADFPVINGEKGILVFNMIFDLDKDETIEVLGIRGGNRANMVPDFCEIKLGIKNLDLKRSLISKLKDQDIEVVGDENLGILTLSTQGVSAHGSLPETGENAVSKMFDILADVMDNSYGLGAFAKEYMRYIGYDTVGERLGCNFEDEKSGRLVFNMGTIDYFEGRITLGINIRYPIETRVDDVYKAIEDTMPYIEIEKLEHKEPIYVEAEDELVNKLLGAYRDITGDYDSEPVVIGGGTYARASKNILGFGPNYPGQQTVAHEKDEHISIKQLIEISKIYSETLYKLVK